MVFDPGPIQISDYISDINRLIISLNQVNSTSIPLVRTAFGASDMTAVLNQTVQALNKAGISIPLFSGPQDTSAFLSLINTLNTLGGASKPALLIAPRLWAFMGNSFVAGTGASPAFPFAQQAPEHAGTRNVSMASPMDGVGGQRSDQIVARIPAAITAGAKGIVIEAGPNDAQQSVPVTGANSFAQFITQGINLCKAAGIPCVVLTVAPTYGGGFNTPAILALIFSYTQWIQANVPGLGATVADVYTALVDTPGATGQMQSKYSVGADGVTAGDGLHPGPLGHYQMGVVTGAAQIAAMAGMSQIVNWAALPNLHPNPLNTGAGSVPDSGVYLFTQNSVNSIVNDASGFLTAGRWCQMDITSTTVNGAFQGLRFAIDPAQWSVGDVMAFGCQAQIQDVTSAFISENFNATSFATLTMWANDGLFTGGGQTVLGPNVGPSLQVFTVPAATTTLGMGVEVKTKQGVETRVRVGNYEVFNLTRLGLVGVIV